MSKSLDIILGVKDKFSKNFSKYSKGADKAGKDTRKLGRDAKKSSKDVNRLGASFKNLAGSFFVANVAGQAFTAGIRLMTDAFRDGVSGAFNQEEQIRTLQTNFRQLGMDVESSTQRVVDWAAEMQWGLGVADDMSEKMVNLGMSMGMTMEEAIDATEIAVGLAKQFGLDYMQAMKMVGQAQAGNTEMLGRYIPAVRAASDEQEKWALIVDASNAGLEKGSENTKSLRGQIEQFKMAIGDVAEALVNQFGESFIGVFKRATLEVNVLQERFKMWYSFVAAVIWEFQSIWNETFGSIGDHAFTFFYNMGVHVGNFVKGAINGFVALADAIGNIFTGLFDWIMSGGEGGWDGLMQKVTDGWREAMDKPGMFDYSETIDYVKNPMGERAKNPFIEDYVKAQEEFNKDFKEQQAKIYAATAEPPKAGDVLKPKGEDLTGLGTSGLGGLESSRFLTTGRSIAKDPGVLTAENTKKTSEGVARMNEQMETMNSNFDTWFDSAQAQGV